jgi:hypothetical protein
VVDLAVETKGAEVDLVVEEIKGVEAVDLVAVVEIKGAEVEGLMNLTSLGFNKQ